MAVGLELEDGRAIVVRVDDNGVVQARAVVNAGDDLGAAAISALAQVAPTGADARALGVATAIPDAASIGAAVRALAPRFGGPFAQQGPMPSGTAAAVAEAWVGAA